MPPKNKPRPSVDEQRLLASWVDGESARADLARRAKEGRVVVRRLNRIEYQNTVRDLLGIQANLIDQLPEEGTANGFDNAGAALHTSSFVMERYLKAAETALDLAICRTGSAVALRFRISASAAVRPVPKPEAHCAHSHLAESQ